MNSTEQLESTVTSLEAHLAALETERAEVSARLLQERRALSEAQQRTAAAAREPQDRARLAELSARLRARIKAAGPRSQTAQDAAALLDRFEQKPNVPVAVQLKEVSACLSNFTRRVQTTDPLKGSKTPAHVPVGKVAL